MVFTRGDRCRNWSAQPVGAIVAPTGCADDRSQIQHLFDGNLLTIAIITGLSDWG